MTHKLCIGNKKYTIESNQGIVLRQNDVLAADYAEGKWVWVNPKLDVPDSDLEKIKGIINAKLKLDDRRKEFESELSSLLNKYCIDKYLATPDFILAEHFVKYIEILRPLEIDNNRWHEDPRASDTMRYFGDCPVFETDFAVSHDAKPICESDPDG